MAASNRVYILPIIVASLLLTQGCQSTRAAQAGVETPGIGDESFSDAHTILLSGHGVAPDTLSGQNEKALAYARLDARLNAESQFRDICYGSSIRPCEPRRRMSPRIAEALKKELRKTKEECQAATATMAASCHIRYEFRYEGLRHHCESTRREDTVKILTAGCGAW